MNINARTKRGPTVIAKDTVFFQTDQASQSQLLLPEFVAARSKGLNGQYLQKCKIRSTDIVYNFCCLRATSEPTFKISNLSDIIWQV